MAQNFDKVLKSIALLGKTLILEGLNYFLCPHLSDTRESRNIGYFGTTRFWPLTPNRSSNTLHSYFISLLSSFFLLSPQTLSNLFSLSLSPSSSKVPEQGKEKQSEKSFLNFVTLNVTTTSLLAAFFLLHMKLGSVPLCSNSSYLYVGSFPTLDSPSTIILCVMYIQSLPLNWPLINIYTCLDLCPLIQDSLHATSSISSVLSFLLFHSPTVWNNSLGLFPFFSPWLSRTVRDWPFILPAS